MKIQFRLNSARLCPFVMAFLLGNLAGGERLSREEIIARRDAAREHNAKLLPEQEAEVKEHPSKSSILDRSIVLSSGRNWTFVPKGALLSVPDAHQEKINASPKKTKYVPFAEFARKNRGWLLTHQVTLDQARGKDPIKEPVRKALMESGRVVVSVCRGGAISTRVPKIEKATAKK